MEMGTIIRGQVVRVSLFHHNDGTQLPPAPPCNYAIEVYGLDGKLLASDGGKLSSGRALT